MVNNMMWPPHMHSLEIACFDWQAPNHGAPRGPAAVIIKIMIKRSYKFACLLTQVAIPLWGGLAKSVIAPTVTVAEVSHMWHESHYYHMY